MLGKKKVSSTSKKKQRWFFNVESIADAEEAIKIGYQTFYALAAIQAVVLVGVYIFSNGSIFSFFDPILMFLLAWFIDHKKSRTAALVLGMHTVLVAIVTLGNRIGVNLGGGFGGTNIVLAALALYGIYMGLQGTFKYHKIVGSEVITKNVWRMTGLFFLYNAVFNVVLFGIFISVSLANPLFWEKLFGYGEDAFPDEVLGVAMMLCILFASAGTVFRVLPGTKNKPLIAIKNADAH